MRDKFLTVLQSIRFRLALWFVLILGAVMILFSIFVYTRQVRDLRSAAVTRLVYQSEKLANTLRITNRDFFNRTPLRIPSDPQSGESFLRAGDVLAFVAANGEVLQSWGPTEPDRVSLWVKQSLKEENLNRPLSASLIPTTIESDNTHVRYLTVLAPVLYERRPVGYYLLGTPLDPDRQLPRLRFSLALGVLLTMGVALVGGFWLADRAIHPVKQITDAARTISETDMARRLQLNRKDELGMLADTFDEMLARLQAAFDRQRQFTADASHELRTPLTIVELETSRSLTGRRSPAEYEHSLQIIQSENRFMTRLVGNLLTLARMDAGQVNLEQQRLDLSDIALEVVERLAPIANREQVRLQAGTLPELFILGDRQYLAQMLGNLVENGIKYSEGADRRVEVSTRAESGYAILRVADNGPGIATEHLPRLFDRFYQVEASRTRTDSANSEEGENLPSGTGLGLSIAQWVAQAHGGGIRVESEVGQGTVFEVRLLLAE